MDLASSQTVGLVSHSLAAIAYVMLAVLMLFNWQRSRIGATLVAACLLTALWAVSRRWPRRRFRWRFMPWCRSRRYARPPGYCS